MRKLCLSVRFVLFFVVLGGMASAQTVSSLQLTENPHSVLSTLVSFEALGVPAGAEVRVRYEAEGDAGETPAYPVENGVQEIAVLGLLPETTYDYTVEVSASGEETSSRTQSFTTGSLPEPLQELTIEATGESPEGYTLVETFLGPKFVFAFDGEGRIRWYKDFRDEPRGFETKLQPNGNFTTYVGLSFGFEPTYGKFIEYTPSGEELRSYAAAPPLYTDSHELLLTTSENGEEFAHFFSYDLRPIDAAPPVGGEAGTRTAGHQLIRQSVDGQIDFFWNAWDHFEAADWIEPRGSEEYEDLDHPNSLDIGEDGHYIVSMRSFGAVLKLNAKTGNLLWQLGGRKNQFEIIDDPLGKFSAQHTAYMTGADTILILDNGARHEPQQSRAVEYKLDLEAMTATMIWEFGPEETYSPIVSSAERLQNGHTLVGFGIPSHIYEVDAQGESVWEATITREESEGAGEGEDANSELGGEGNGVPFYRANRLVSLYEYSAP